MNSALRQARAEMNDSVESCIARLELAKRDHDMDMVVQLSKILAAECERLTAENADLREARR